MLAILRRCLEMDLRHREDQDGPRVRPDRRRGVRPSTVDNRVKNAWGSLNDREREDAAATGHEPESLQPITLHECRHTFASLLIDAGANPKAIQTFMGHSKIQTFDIYGHLLPGSHDEVLERMDEYLSNSR